MLSFVIFFVVSSAYAASTNCRQPVTQDNYQSLLSAEAQEFAKHFNTSVASAQYVGFDGDVIKDDVHKSSASVIAHLGNGMRFHYTMIVEDNCWIGGFGGGSN